MTLRLDLKFTSKSDVFFSYDEIAWHWFVKGKSWFESSRKQIFPRLTFRSCIIITFKNQLLKHLPSLNLSLEAADAASTVFLFHIHLKVHTTVSRIVTRISQSEHKQNQLVMSSFPGESALQLRVYQGLILWRNCWTLSSGNKVILARVHKKMIIITLAFSSLPPRFKPCICIHHRGNGEHGNSVENSLKTFTEGTFYEKSRLFWYQIIKVCSVFSIFPSSSRWWNILKATQHQKLRTVLSYQTRLSFHENQTKFFFVFIEDWVAFCFKVFRIYGNSM